MRLPAAAMILSLMGCAQFPALDDATSTHAADAPYPDLVPVEIILSAAASTQQSPQTASNLTARVAALRTRAGRLQGRVVDSATRQRMRRGVPVR